jgi:2-polyprenyl-3-methyl-5-hydroxy-6-metoxy-1,4-benzoquinol methylase
MNKAVEFNKRTNFGNQESNILFLSKMDNIFNKKSKILEIGSGTGFLLDYFYKQGYDIQGIEIDFKRIEKSEELYGKLPIKLMSGDELLFGDSIFDVVISFDVFEHIPDTNLHLNEIYRVLKPGGYYLLQTPNKWTNVIFETIRWKSFTKWKIQHCSLHSYRQIIKRFNTHNFEVKFHNIPVVNNFFTAKLKWYVGNWAVTVLKIINPDKLPIPLRTGFYISAKKL